MSILFSVNGHPEPAGSKKAFVVKGRAVVTDANRRSKPWQTLVSAGALESVSRAGPDRAGALFSFPLSVKMRFRVHRPNGHFKTDGSLSAAGLRTPWPAVRPDLLKLARGVEDAISGVIWRDDAQIVVERLSKVYTVPGQPEGVDVEVDLAGVAL